MKIFYCRFTLSGRVTGAVGGESCSNLNGGPANVNVELLSPSDDVVSSALTSYEGNYVFSNIIPGLKYLFNWLRKLLQFDLRKLNGVSSYFVISYHQ